MIRLLPNFLSAARLLAAPYVCFLLWRQQYRTALTALLLAALTDGLDGYLARSLNAQSRLGEVLDPIADKVLMGGAFLTLAFSGAIEPWLAVLVVGRDVLILLVAAGSFGPRQRHAPIPSIDMGQAEHGLSDRFRGCADLYVGRPAAEVSSRHPQMGDGRDDDLERRGLCA